MRRQRLPPAEPNGRSGRSVRWLALGVGGVVLLAGAFLLLRPAIESAFDAWSADVPTHGEVAPAPADVSASAPPSSPSSSSPAPAGALRDLGGGVQESPAGLRYGPGSSEGHRLLHVLRHAGDQPARRGFHGVFDGDRATIVSVIDEAYNLARDGPSSRVSVERDGGRTVYTVDLGRRVGFAGGAEGNRRGRPAATHVRLVLEGRDVITAFPLLAPSR